MSLSRPRNSELPGEDLATPALSEVASWISIYEELGSVLRAILSRADGHSADGHSNGQSGGGELHKTLTWVDGRLESWRDRHAELAGVQLDRKDHTLTYAGKSVRLTRREGDLLDFLLRHPRRTFTTKQLATLAWQNSRLSDAQVRTYIMRLRSRLREIGLEHVLSAVRNQGYGANLIEGANGQ
jgi:DNA-binding response OmpR family regulator